MDDMDVLDVEKMEQEMRDGIRKALKHTLTAEIDKLKMWIAGEWKSYTSIPTKEMNITLRIHYDQIFIISENKVLESLNVNGKIKGIYKDDVLILITCNAPNQVRKIKFRIKTNIVECFQKLRLHFPIVNYNNSTHLQHQAKYKSIEEVLKTAISEKGAVGGPPIPSNFSDFVKFCLLDPSFPKIVNDVQDVVHQMISK